MSMTKRELDEQNAAESISNCPDCTFNYDDKFFNYCPQHETKVIAEAMAYPERMMQMESEFIRN